MNRPLIRMEPGFVRLFSPSGTAAAHSKAALTRHGVLLADGKGPSLSELKLPEITGLYDVMHNGAAFDAVGDEAPAHAAARAHELHPRALRWAVTLRGLAAHLNLDIDDVALDLAAIEGPAATRDVLLATALLGWDAEDALDEDNTAVLTWRQRRPWSDLRVGIEGDAPREISRATPLPVKVRFGRSAFESGTPVGSTLTVDVTCADESLRMPVHGVNEFYGRREFELTLSADGRIAVDLLVDETWRPLPAIAAPLWAHATNKQAQQIYGSLSHWSAALEALRSDYVAAGPTLVSRG